MKESTRNTLRRLEATHRDGGIASATRGRLKVFYGWSKINKIQKREAIAVAFENEELAGDENRRSGKSLRKTMTVVAERWQTPEEKADAHFSNRVFTVFNVFMDDKHVQGSLTKALAENMKADANNVCRTILKDIRDQLERAYLAAHPGYKEPVRQLELRFGK